MIKTLLKSLLRFFLILFLTLGISELAVRIIGYSEIYLYDPIYMPCSESPEIPFVLKPNLTNAKAHGNIRINTDCLGLRSLFPGTVYETKKPEEFRIAVVGSSVTFGYGVETGDTFAVLLEKRLNEAVPNRRTIVFNFGTASFSVKEIAATAEQRTRAVDPDLIIAALAYGDYNLTRTPGVDNEGYNTHGQTSSLLSRYPVLKQALRKIHLVYVVRDAIGAIQSYTDKNPQPDVIPASYRFLPDIKKNAAQRGVACFVVTMPSLGADGSEFRPTLEALKLDGVKYLDVSNLSLSFSPAEFKASRFDAYHPSAKVHRKIAEALSDFILANYLPNDRGN